MKTDKVEVAKKNADFYILSVNDKCDFVKYYVEKIHKKNNLYVLATVLDVDNPPFMNSTFIFKVLIQDKEFHWLNSNSGTVHVLTINTSKLKLTIYEQIAAQLKLSIPQVNTTVITL